MSDNQSLTPEQMEAVLKDFKAYVERGFLDPVLVFDPKGFDFSISYLRDEQRTVPIPEFRVYARQFLTLLAIVLLSSRKHLPSAATTLRCWVEVSGVSLALNLVAEVPLSSATSSAQMSPLHLIGSAFSSALRLIFPALDVIFWDHELNTGHARFWTKYPGGMTPSGFLQTLRAPNVVFSSLARLEIPQQRDELCPRAKAVLDFILSSSAPES